MTNSDNFIQNSALNIQNPTIFWGQTARFWVFLLLFIGFAIKLPAVPFHTWLPDAHVEAPTPISIVLAGVLLKIGGYGIIRTAFSIFPDVARDFALICGVLGLISMLYGGLVALGQKNLKRMIAYSSVSHIGFVLLGLAALTPEAVNGAIFQLFSHGILAAMLFFCAGVLYERTQDLEIENYRGLASKMPKYTAFVTIAFFASLGLPAFSAFVAEALVFIGAFRSKILPTWVAVSALLVLLISAAYYLWTMQRMFFGKFSLKNAQNETLLIDLNRREFILLLFLALTTLALGIMPQLILKSIEKTVVDWLLLF